MGQRIDFMTVLELDINLQKNKPQDFSHIINKSTLKHIIDLKMKSTTTKLLEENTGENLQGRQNFQK